MNSEKINIQAGQVSVKQDWTAPLIVTLQSSETEAKDFYMRETTSVGGRAFGPS